MVGRHALDVKIGVRIPASELMELKFFGFLFGIIFVSAIVFVIHFNVFKSRDFSADFLYSIILLIEKIGSAQQDVGAFEIEKMETPDVVKAVYLTSWSAGRNSKIDYVINLAKTAGVNAVVIDIKDYSGYVFYDSKLPAVIKYGAKKKRISGLYLVHEQYQRQGD